MNIEDFIYKHKTVYERQFTAYSKGKRSTLSDISDIIFYHDISTAIKKIKQLKF